MIAQTDADVRILTAIPLKHSKQAAAQRKAAGRDMDNAALQALIGEDFFLGGFNAFKGNGNVLIQLFALRCQPDPMCRTKNNEQRSSDSSLRIMRVTFGWLL